MHLFWRLITGNPGLGENLEGDYDPFLVVLSIAVACLAGFAALSVVDRINQSRSSYSRRIWLAAGTGSMGAGIWAMHFTAMLAFSMEGPLKYDLLVTIASVLPAMFGSGFALHFMARPNIGRVRLQFGALLMAIGIGTMHYVGMEAMQMQAILRYDVVLFVVSIVVAHILASLALHLKVVVGIGFVTGHVWLKTGASIIMGLAVAGMHYTAMAAARFYPGTSSTSFTGLVFSPLAIVESIIIITSMILICAIIAARIDKWMQHAAEALQESKARELAVLKTMADAMILTNEEGLIEVTNPATYHIFDYDNSSLLGKNIDVLLPDSSTQTPLIPVETKGNSSGSYNIHETTSRRKDGSLFPVEFSRWEIEMEGEKRISWLIRDLSESKRAEALQVQTLRANKLAAQAKAANKAKSEFLANMSHEIRTPMNGVIGMTSLLLSTPLSTEQRDYVDTIRISGDSLLNVINDILDFSKIESGKLHLENQSFCLRECLEDVLDLFAPKAAEKRLELAYFIHEPIPKAIHGDVTRLRQILVNLISNAIKFTGEGEVILTLSCKSLNTDSYELLFSVRDTGIGIPLAHTKQIFYSFSQADTSTTRKYGGTGLGLTISKQLCELMGGTMWVESEGIDGGGSTFYFTIEATAGHDTEEKATSDVVNKLKGKRVLIVDDNEASRKILVHHVSSWEMLPSAFSSGIDALIHLNQETGFEIAILDMQMPDMDGLALAQQIRASELTADLPLIMLSSVGQQIVDSPHYEAGITKPIKPNHLLNAMVNIISGESTTLTTRVEATPFDARLANEHPLRILLAEDNLVNQKVAVRILEQLGYRVDVVANGLEVLEALARQCYDVVLMDIQMPELDGIETTRIIRDHAESSLQPQIIALTANVIQDSIEKYEAVGMDGLIAKPIRVQELIDVLRNCTSQTSRPATYKNVL